MAQVLLSKSSVDRNEIKLGLKVSWQGLVGTVIAYTDLEAMVKFEQNLKWVCVFELEIVDELFQD